jgi:hypothetical protein
MVQPEAKGTTVVSDKFLTNQELNEKLVSAIEGIAKALGGLHEEAKQAGKRYWPEPREQREAVLSRVPTEEDRIKERQGAGANVPIEQWLTELGDPEGADSEYIGEREREWRRTHPEEEKKEQEPNASAEANSAREQNSSGPEKAEGQA